MEIMYKQAFLLITGCIFVGWLLNTNSNELALLMMAWTLIMLEWNRRDDIKNNKCDP